MRWHEPKFARAVYAADYARKLEKISYLRRFTNCFFDTVRRTDGRSRRAIDVGFNFCRVCFHSSELSANFVGSISDLGRGRARHPKFLNWIRIIRRPDVVTTIGGWRRSFTRRHALHRLVSCACLAIVFVHTSLVETKMGATDAFSLSWE